MITIIDTRGHILAQLYNMCILYLKYRIELSERWLMVVRRLIPSYLDV